MKNSLLKLFLLVSKFTLYGFIIPCFMYNSLFAIDGNVQKKGINKVHIALSDKSTNSDGFITEGDTQSESVLQTKTVSGKVTSAENGEEIPGVNVIIKGTSEGTVTDISGNFSIEVPSPETTLKFSYIGYVSEEIVVGNQSVVNVALAPDVTTLQEIVVVDVGYGTVKRSDLTGSVSSLSGKDLAKIPVASAAEAITGRMPGVSVLTTDGSPDAEVVIRVRGGGSITQDNSPLYVVDGFIVSSIRDIPPTDIVSIDVLKDAAATAIYGARGANGVIVVNTKRPQVGKTSVSYNGFAKFAEFPQNRKMEVLGPYEYVLAQYEFNKLRSETDLQNFEKLYGKYDDLELYQYKPGTDWQDELMGGTRFSQYHNITVNGGSERTRMNLSLTHNDEEGLLSNSGYKRSVVNFKLAHNISDRLELDAYTRVTNTVVDGAGTSGRAQFRVGNMVKSRPVNGIADELDIDLNNTTNDDDFTQFLKDLIDPRELLGDDWRKRTTQNYVLNAGLKWDITDNLQFNTVFTSETQVDERLRFYGPLTSESRQEGSSLPLGTKEDRDNWSYRWYNTIKYELTDIGFHHLDVLIGQEVNSEGGKSQNVRAEDFRVSISPDELFANMQLGTTVEHSTAQRKEENILSYFGRLNYSWNDKFLLTATLRRDASSLFSENQRVGYFPAVAVAWKLSEESFVQSLEFVDQLKFRVSYGETGNNRVDLNATTFVFAASTNNGPGFSTNDYNVYYSPSGDVLYNPDLRWETTINRNVGIDFSLFKSRINGNFDLYYNTTNDLLLQSAISQTSGFTSQWNNIGSTSNKGLEVALNAYLIDKPDFTLSFNFNIGMNRSNIDELDGTDERFLESNWASTDLKDRGDYYLKKGRTVGLIYGYVTDGMYTVDDFESYDEVNSVYVLRDGVVNDKTTLGVNNLRPGFLKLKDLNGDGIIDSEDRQVIGSTLPLSQGGFGVNAAYKGFDASIFFNWSYGNDVYNTGKIEFNQLYRSNYGNMLNTQSMDRRFTYIDVDGSYTGTPGELVTDLEQLRDLNEGKEIWSGSNSFGTATAVIHNFGVEDASFLRLNTLTLGYSLPESVISKIKISQFRIYATGYNLWLWTNYSGYDPEVSTTRNTDYQALTPGQDYSAYPRSRSYTVGVNITF